MIGCTHSAGVKEWDATNSTFPDGLAAFAEKSGWKFQMHNRMWSDDNVYATQNGGKYKFIVEPQVTERIADSDFRNLRPVVRLILTLAIFKVGGIWGIRSCAKHCQRDLVEV